MPQTREDIPRALRSLQTIDSDSELKAHTFTVQDRALPEEVNRES